MKNPWELTPEKKRAFALARELARPDDGYFYASMIPAKKNLETGKVSPAMPKLLSDALTGTIDLIEGVGTGQITPQASAALPMFMTGGLVSGAPHGALMSGGARYYKNTYLIKKGLEKFLEKNNIDFSAEHAKTGSSYYTINRPDGKVDTVRVADHNNQSRDTRKDMYQWMIYPAKDNNPFNESGGHKLSDLQKFYREAFGSKMAKKTGTKRPSDDELRLKLEEKFFNPFTPNKKPTEIASERMGMSDKDFLDIYGVDKETVKRILGLDDAAR